MTETPKHLVTQAGKSLTNARYCTENKRNQNPKQRVGEKKKADQNQKDENTKEQPNKSKPGKLTNQRVESNRKRKRKRNRTFTAFNKLPLRKEVTAAKKEADEVGWSGRNRRFGCAFFWELFLVCFGRFLV